MNRKLLIALAMALLVPLQGLAAATAGICMAMGHHDAPPAAAVDHEQGGDHGDHGAAHGDGPQTSHEHDPDAQDSSHCVPCVACCASASIAPQYSVSFAAEPAAAPPARTVPAVAGAVLQQLDRPPLVL